MKFRQFIIAAADRIGRQHLPVHDPAHDINEFIGPDSVHDDLAPSVVRAIYRANRCGHLDAHIQADETFDALGQCHGELLRKEDTDLSQLQFIQAFGELACTLLLDDRQSGDNIDNVHRDQNETSPDYESGLPKQPGDARVVQFQR